MEKIISCEYDIDTACVEVKYQDGSMISNDCTRVEYEVARNMYEASEQDWLVYVGFMSFSVGVSVWCGEITGHPGRGVPTVCHIVKRM